MVIHQNELSYANTIGDILPNKLGNEIKSPKQHIYENELSHIN